MSDVVEVRKHAWAYVTGRVDGKATTPASTAKLLFFIVACGQIFSPINPAHAVEPNVLDTEAAQEVNRALRCGFITRHRDNSDPSPETGGNRPLNCFDGSLLTSPDAGYRVASAIVI